ncbi:MAG TPA: class I SAM-dependent methyltransferase [Phycisphaerae bacterium]|nr:class I SAM-dependent methyltransferase [Phycisphaerae bacterium]
MSDNKQHLPNTHAAEQEQADREILDARAIAWNNRPVLRAVYNEYFQQMTDWLAVRNAIGPRPHGRVLEVGGGAGHFKTFYPDVIVTDIVPCSHIDLAADAMRLPFAENSLDNIVMHDVLHHLAYPLVFLTEAKRVLRPGGRIIMTEPYASPVSWIFYKLMHPEPLDMSTTIFPESGESNGKLPPATRGQGAFASNQAIPTLIFFRQIDRFREQFPDLMLKHRSIHSMLVYPLSGGFSKPVLLPQFAFPAARAIERICSPLAPLLGFRTLVVLEKT